MALKSGFNWDVNQSQSSSTGGDGDGLTTADVAAIVDARIDTLTPANIGAVAGNDPRLSDARTPTAHKLTHATGGSDVLSPADIGAAASDDARLSDARTPILHASTHVASGDDPLTAEDIGAAPLGAIADIAGLRSDVDGLMEDIHNKEHFRGYYESTAQIQTLSSPSAGDFAYSAETGTKWIFNAETSSWENSGIAVPNQAVPPSNATPLTDGTASAGTSNEYARGDHRHQILADASTSLAGKVMLATANDTTSADKAATPAGVAVQVAPVLAVANAAQSIANAATDAAQAALDAVEGAVTEVTWDNIADKPAEFFPAPHAATHLPGGSDPIEGLGEEGGGSRPDVIGSVKQYMSINVPSSVVVLDSTKNTILRKTTYPELYAIAEGSPFIVDDEIVLPPYSVEPIAGFVWGMVAGYSSGLDYELLPLKPMTGKDIPSPYVVDRSSVSAQPSWRLFDHVYATGWTPQGESAAWLSFVWNSPRRVIGYEVLPNPNATNKNPQLTVFGLLEGGAYEQVEVFPKPDDMAAGVWRRFVFTDQPVGPYYGLRWNSATGASTWNPFGFRVMAVPV